MVHKIGTVDPETGRMTAMYDLTTSGRKLEKLMVQMAVWGKEHKERVATE